MKAVLTLGEICELHEVIFYDVVKSNEIVDIEGKGFMSNWVPKIGSCEIMESHRSNLDKCSFCVPTHEEIFFNIW